MDCRYRDGTIKDNEYFKKSYKIQFWSSEKINPIFEQISDQRILEKYVKNRNYFLDTNFSTFIFFDCD